MLAKLSQWVQQNKLKALRSIRFFNVLFNLLHRKELIYLQPLYSKYKVKKRWFSTIQSSDLHRLPEQPLWLDTKDSEAYMPQQAFYERLTSENQEALRGWSQQGYAHLKQFFTAEQTSAIAAVSDGLWHSQNGKWRFGDRRVKAAFEHRILWDMAHQETLLSIISCLLGDKAVLLNSINFMRGDEQPAHSDSFYMTTYPAGRLIGIWIALEDIQPGTGALKYYPGSHRLPYTTNADLNNLGNFWTIGNNGEQPYEEHVRQLIAKHGLKEVYHLPKKGDVLLWHANLLHGGSKIDNKEATRKSMVCHYVGSQALAFHEISQRPALRPNPFT
ncbi:MAG: hypothetical protein RL226_2258 [Bacteroidota bacterium]